MQDSLTFLYDLVLGVGGTYIGLGFIAGVINLWQKCSPDYAGKATEEVSATQAVEEEEIEAVEEEAIEVVEEEAVPLELPISSAVEREAVALPELVVQDEDRELEPVELVEDMEEPAPPKQLEM